MRQSSFDPLSPKERSILMGKVKHRDNKTTELTLMQYLKEEKISGWRRHLPIPGRPDFSFRKQKVAVFVDGCFWHGCPKCFRLPKQNRAFWKAKIEGNRKRDRSVNSRLRRLGWKVLRLRECKLNKVERILARLNKVLSNKEMGAL